MDIRTLQNFLQLAETLNYRKTAESILIAQPALSRQIRILEEEIGAELFIRTKRSVQLTEAGLFFKNEVQRMVQQIDEMVHRTAEIHRGEAGTLRIGHASSSMHSVLPQILVTLRERFPNLKTLLIEASNRFEIEALRNRDIDLGFAPNMIVPPDFESLVIYRENFVLILPESHPLSVDTFQSVAQVAHENFIIPPRMASHGYVETIEAICQSAGFLPRVEQESGHSATVLRLVEAGLGVSIEPKSSLNAQNMRVKFIELHNIPQKAEMKLIWLRERTHNIQKFLTVIESFITE